MTKTISTGIAAQIPSLIQEPARGTISLVGDQGGLSLITGDIRASGLIMGTLLIKTEHGIVYLEPESETRISEDGNADLSSEELGSINDALAELMGSEFNSSANHGLAAYLEDRADERIDDLTHAVGSLIQDLLAAEKAYVEEVRAMRAKVEETFTSATAM